MKKAILLLLALFMADVQGNTPLLELQLQHRSAEELIPLLRPLAGPGASVAGRGFLLFLRAEPARLEELQRAVRRLDTPARRLSISVYQGSAADLERLVAGRHKIRSTRDRKAVTQRVQVLEGNRAFIAVGRSVPQPDLAVGVGPAGGYVWQENRYRETRSGFYVRPSLNGERVTLDITPFDEQPSGRGDEIQVRGAATRISGRLGEWLPVAGHDQGLRADRREPLIRHSTRSREEWQVFVRVDPAP